MRHFLLDPLREIAPPPGDRIRLTVPSWPMPTRREIGRARRRLARAKGRRRARRVSVMEATCALYPTIADVEHRVLKGIQYAYEGFWGRFYATVYTDRPLTADEERAIKRALRGHPAPTP